jgi:hypothetical protein
MALMLRSSPFVVVIVLVALAVTGCASEASEPPAAVPAAPQEASLDWVEPTPADTPALVFEVRAIAITEDGWRADVAIHNESDLEWGVLAEGLPASFGVMLFATGELDELERRNAERDLPGLRPAHVFEPALPGRLAPGESWEGTMAAPGSLASRRWLRVVFGPLVTEGDPPEGLPAHLVWITDHAYRLRR